MERRFYLVHEPQNLNCPQILGGIFIGDTVRVTVTDALSPTENWSEYIKRKEIDGLFCDGCGEKLVIPPLKTCQSKPDLL